MIDLSIVIVSWNTRELLKKCLASIFNETHDINFEVFVVDNASRDQTAEMVRNTFSQVRLIANTKNLGFAKACNQAIGQSQRKFILLLNPDMRVLDNAIAKTWQWMSDNPRVTLATCQLVNAKGEIVKNVRAFPKFSDQLAIVLKLPHLFPKILSKYLMNDFDYTKASRVDSIRGAFFMISRENYQKISGATLPLLDERYFIWFEEVDFCKNVASLGGETWYAPAAKCLDFVGQSFKQVKTLTAQKYFRDSMLKYFKKWHPLWQTCILRFCWFFVLIPGQLINIFKTKKHNT